MHSDDQCLESGISATTLQKSQLTIGMRLDFIKKNVELKRLTEMTFAIRLTPKSYLDLFTICKFHLRTISLEETPVTSWWQQEQNSSVQAVLFL